MSIEFTKAETLIVKLQELLVGQQVSQGIISEATKIVSARKGASEAYLLSKNKLLRFNFVAWEERVRAGQIYGRAGEIEYSEDGEEIQCHLCGQFFRQLSRTHIQAHGIGSADDYRALLGLNKNQGLLALRYSEEKSEYSISHGIVPPPGAPFFKGKDERREGEHRLQKGVKTSRRAEMRRVEGRPSLGIVTKDPETRSLHQGRFSLFGSDYYFSKNGETVTIISVTDDSIVVEGKLKDGVVVTKTYKRDDRKKQ